MKNIYNTAQIHFIRRWVIQLFSSWINRQDCNYLKELFEKLQDIEDLMNIIAQEIARQAKRDE
jgi:hypothetical protein